MSAILSGRVAASLAGTSPDRALSPRAASPLARSKSRSGQSAADVLRRLEYFEMENTRMQQQLADANAQNADLRKRVKQLSLIESEFENILAMVRSHRRSARAPARSSGGALRRRVTAVTALMRGGVGAQEETTRSHIAKHAEESQQIADDHSHLQSEHGRVRSALARYASAPPAARRSR